MKRVMRLMAAAAALALTLALAGAAPAPVETKAPPPIASTLYVALRDSDRVALIDIDRLEIGGVLPVGLAPRDLAVSDRLGQLVVGDGRSRVNLIDLASGEIHALHFDFAPTRVLLAPGGARLAALDPAAGVVAFVDLATRREIARVVGLGRIRDVLFDSDGRLLYASIEGRDGLTAIDADRGGETRRVAELIFGRLTALVRSPDGRELFGAGAETGSLDRLDLRHGLSSGRLAVGSGLQDVAVSGAGRFILLPDNARRRVLVASAEPFRIAAELEGGRGMAGAYSAWFDLVAFVPSVAERRLLAYDLDRLATLADIPLHGAPGPGVVSPDGSKLFLPLEDAGAVEAIDARLRRVARTIRVEGAPIAVAIAGGYGVCH